jgi:hypothetical protein
VILCSLPRADDGARRGPVTAMRDQPDSWLRDRGRDAQRQEEVRRGNGLPGRAVRRDLAAMPERVCLPRGAEPWERTRHRSLMENPVPAQPGGSGPVRTRQQRPQWSRRDHEYHCFGDGYSNILGKRSRVWAVTWSSAATAPRLWRSPGCMVAVLSARRRVNQALLAISAGLGGVGPVLPCSTCAGRERGSPWSPFWAGSQIRVRRRTCRRM